MEYALGDLIPGSLHDRLPPDIRCVMVVTSKISVSVHNPTVNQRFDPSSIEERSFDVDHLMEVFEESNV